jgi:antitoxin (DNA-binding transcriptional repressor) of toxin-antitoxin stability system
VIVQTDDLALEALDYELLWFGTDLARSATGDFRDVHHVEQPVWRLVSGYLAVARDGGAWQVTSHGHPVAELTPEQSGCRVAAVGTLALDDGVLVAAEAGLALVPDEHTRFVLEGGGARATGWGFTIVHGPSAEKVQNRRALLASILRTGGAHV